MLGGFVGSLLGGCRVWGCFVGVLLIFFLVMDSGWEL